MRQCGECGVPIATGKDFCSIACEDLWTYGPKRTPGYSLLDGPDFHRDSEGKRVRWGGRRETDPPSRPFLETMTFDPDSLPF